MYQFSTEALIFLAATVIAIAALMFILSFRDTWRGFYEFWELNKAKRFFRGLASWRPRLTLPRILWFCLLVPHIVAILFILLRHGAIGTVLCLMLSIVLLVPLPYVALKHLFEHSGRKRWERYVTRKLELDAKKVEDE